jgi:hypothetical protein
VQGLCCTPFQPARILSLLAAWPAESHFSCLKTGLSVVGVTQSSAYWMIFGLVGETPRLQAPDNLPPWVRQGALLERVHVPDSSFDRVLAVEVTEHIENPGLCS